MKFLKMIRSLRRTLSDRSDVKRNHVDASAPDKRHWLWIENCWTDVRQAVNRLVRRPGATAAMVLTLATALGINSAVIAISRSILFKDASPADGKRLCSVYLATKDAERRMRGFCHNEIETLRAARDVFAEVGAFTFELGVARVDEELKRTFFVFVDDGFFRVHQINPIAGRFFTAAETKSGAGIPAVVVSAEFVQQQGWTPALALGRTVHVNGVATTIIGVAPLGFSGISSVAGPRFWLPLGLDRAALRSLPENVGLDAPGVAALFPLALLQPGLTRETAAPAIDVLSTRLPLPADDNQPRQLLLEPMRRFGLGATPEPRAPLRLVVTCALTMAALVLIVACSNLASLQLARGSLRQKEIAIRLALGAGRGRILSSLLVEDLLVALTGGALGLLLSTHAVHGLLALIQSTVPNNMAFTANPSPDLWSIALTFAGCLVATLLFGLAPALALTRTDLLTAMKTSTQGISARVRWWPRNLLTGVQTALAVVLVVGAALFFFGLKQAVSRNPGFKVENRFVAELDFSALKWSDDRIRHALRDLTDDPGSLAAAEHYSFGTILPYGDWQESMGAKRSDAPGEQPQQIEGTLSRIGPGYFATLGIPLLRGRDFNSADLADSEPSILPAIIDQRMARELYGKEDPIGRTIVMGENQKAQIVGVCGSHWMNPLAAQACCWLFIPARQVRSIFIYLQTPAHGMSGHVAAVLVRQRLTKIDPALVATSVRSMESVIIASPQLGALWVASALFGACGLVAALLALVGVYAVKSYQVARRTPEIGIRIALGARAGQVQRMVLDQTLWQAALACTIGAILAMAISKPLGGLMHIDGPTGAALVLMSAGGLFLAVLAAAWLPARRATKINPLEALRAE